MATTTRQVTSKSELDAAIKDKVDEILIIGDLANKVAKTKSLGRLSGWKKKAFLGCMAGAAAGAAAVPFSGGASGIASAGFVAPAVALTGLEIATIMSVAFIGAGMLLALHKDYEEIEVSKESVRFRKKSK